MIVILNWIAFSLGAAFFWWVEYQDDKWSDIFELTAAGEANWWSRDKTGYYSRAKGLRNTGIYFAVVLAGAIFIPVAYSPLIGGIFLAGAGGAIWSVVHKNVKIHKAKRTAQLKTLADIKRDPDNTPLYLGKANRSADKQGRTFWFFKSFWDIRAISTFQIPGGVYPDVEMKINAARLVAEAELIPRFRKLALEVPESEWFKVGRAQKV